MFPKHILSHFKSDNCHTTPIFAHKYFKLGVRITKNRCQKKNTTEIWDVFYEKTQHGDLDIINGHPSMFLFFAFVMIHVRGVFFDRFLNFFRILTLPHPFWLFSAKNYILVKLLCFLES